MSASSELKFNGKSAMEIIAKAVQRECNRIAYRVTHSVLRTTPIWTGVMINSWDWSKDTAKYKKPPEWKGTMELGKDGKMYPRNPLPRPSIEEVIPNYTYKSTEFPALFFTCSVDYAYEVDQGVGRYKAMGGFPRLIVKQAVDEIKIK